MKSLLGELWLDCRQILRMDLLQIFWRIIGEFSLQQAVCGEFVAPDLSFFHINFQNDVVGTADISDETLKLLSAQTVAPCSLAFQVQDDILDVESDTATLGKTQGKDEANHKPTYPALLGMEAAKAYALELRDQALHALRPFGASAEPLRELARYIVERRS